MDRHEPAVVHQRRVDLVDDEQHVVRDAQRGDRGELGPRPDPPDRVVRAAQQVGAGSVGEGLLQRRQVEPVRAVVAAGERDLDDLASGVLDRAEERLVDRRVDHDTVAWRGAGLQHLQHAPHDVLQDVRPRRVDREPPAGGGELRVRLGQVAGPGVAGVGPGDHRGELGLDRGREVHVHLGHPQRQHVRPVGLPLDAAAGPEPLQRQVEDHGPTLGPADTRPAPRGGVGEPRTAAATFCRQCRAVRRTSHDRRTGRARGVDSARGQVRRSRGRPGEGRVTASAAADAAAAAEPTALRARAWRAAGARGWVDPTLIGALTSLVAAVGYWRPSIWTDEAATITSATRSLPELWHMIHNIDAVHGLYYLFMHFWIAVFGSSALSIRLPSLLAVGIAAAGTVVLARRLTNRSVALLAGVALRTAAPGDLGRHGGAFHRVHHRGRRVDDRRPDRRAAARPVVVGGVRHGGVALDPAVPRLRARRRRPRHDGRLDVPPPAARRRAVGGLGSRRSRSDSADLTAGPSGVLQINPGRPGLRRTGADVLIKQFFLGAPPTHRQEFPSAPLPLWAVSSLLVAVACWALVLWALVRRADRAVQRADAR